MLVGYLVPGFSRLTFGTAIIAAIVIAVLGWIAERLFGEHINPYGRGIVGFIAGAVVIYLAQLFIPGMTVTIWGALLASLVIGIIDLFIPVQWQGARGVDR
jgi:uncharacterized membrane protein YvlD (DUF360 family)